MKILLAVDGSACSDAAVADVAEGPWPPGSEVMIVSAFEVSPPVGAEIWAVPAGYIEEILAAARARAEAAVASARDRVAASDGLAVSTEVLHGSPARAILDKAAEWGADLIVLGSHGYGAVKRFLLGSVSHAVALHADCSVEIVRQRECDAPAPEPPAGG